MGGPISQCCCDTEGGYKHVVAAVRWLGGEHPYGYLTPAELSLVETCADVDRNWWDADPCPGSACSGYIPYSPDPPDHKYLGFQLEITWDHHQSRYATCDVCVTTDIVWDFHFRRSYDSHTDRYSAEGTSSDIMTWDETYVDNVVPANSYEYHLTGQDALDRFNAMYPPYTGLDAECGHLQPTGPDQPPDPPGGEWVVTSEGVTDNSCYVNCEMNVDETTNNACSCSGSFVDDDHLIKTASFNCTTLLYDKFTTAELYQTAKNLLALWDLGDDTRYPWRTSCGGEAYHLGALVTFDYGGDIFGVPGATIGGPYTGETWSVGAHALTGYSAEGSSGGSVWFNNAESVWGIVVSGVIVPYGGDYFVLGKWAEKKITLPGHNYARPCGADHWAKVENTYASDLCWPPASMVNTLTSDGTNPSDGDQVAISNGAAATYTTYTFRTTPGALPEVQIGADATASMLNLKNAINAYPDPLVTATVSGLVITITGGSATKARAASSASAVRGAMSPNSSGEVRPVRECWSVADRLAATDRWP